MWHRKLAKNVRVIAYLLVQDYQVDLQILVHLGIQVTPVGHFLPYLQVDLVDLKLENLSDFIQIIIISIAEERNRTHLENLVDHVDKYDNWP